MRPSFGQWCQAFQMRLFSFSGAGQIHHGRWKSHGSSRDAIESPSAATTTATASLTPTRFTSIDLK